MFIDTALNPSLALRRSAMFPAMNCSAPPEREESFLGLRSINISSLRDEELDRRTLRRKQEPDRLQIPTWIRNAQLFVVVLCAAAVKLYYSTASVDQLRWILAPTTFVVGLISGSRFEFESHAGYLNSDRSFVIAASCAGVNFLI